MPDTTEKDWRLKNQTIVVEREKRRYEAAVNAYRLGVKRITANAREEIARLKLARDEARFSVSVERNTLDLCEAEKARGFES